MIARIAKIILSIKMYENKIELLILKFSFNIRKKKKKGKENLRVKQTLEKY